MYQKITKATLSTPLNYDKWKADKLEQIALGIEAGKITPHNMWIKVEAGSSKVKHSEIVTLLKSKRLTLATLSGFLDHYQMSFEDLG